MITCFIFRVFIECFELFNFKFIIKNDLMYPISTEQLRKRVWERQYVNANKDYIFKETNLE